VGFRKSNELVAVGREDLALHTWPADDGPKATTTLLTGSRTFGPVCALSPDARYAGCVAGEESRLVVWDLSGDKPAEYLSREIQNVYGLEFSAMGNGWR
jgi:hypothetical protein